MTRGEVHYAPPTEDGGGVFPGQEEIEIEEISPDDLVEIIEEKKLPPPVPENAKKKELLAGEAEAFFPFAEAESPVADRSFPDGLLGIGNSEILSMQDGGRVVKPEERDSATGNETRSNPEELQREQEVTLARKALDRVAEQTSDKNRVIEAYRKNSRLAESGESEQRQFLQKYGSYQKATHLQQHLSKREVARSKREVTLFGRISNKLRDAFSSPPSQTSEDVGQELVRFHEIERHKKSAEENLNWIKEQITSKKFTLPEIMNLVEANSNNKNLAMMIAEEKPIAIQNFSQEILHDPEVIMKVIDTMPRAVGFAKDYFSQLSPEKAFEILQPVFQKDPGVYSVLPPELHSNETFGRLVIDEIKTWPEDKADNALGNISQFLDGIADPNVRSGKEDLRVKLGLPEPKPQVGVVYPETKRNRLVPKGRSSAAANRPTRILGGISQSHGQETEVNIPIHDATDVDIEILHDDEEDGDSMMPESSDTNPSYVSAPDTPIRVPVLEDDGVLALPTQSRRSRREPTSPTVVSESPTQVESSPDLGTHEEKILDVEREKLPSQRELLAAMFSLYRSDPYLVKAFLAEYTTENNANLPKIVSDKIGSKELNTIEPAQASLLQEVLADFDELQDVDKEIIFDIAELLQKGEGEEVDNKIFGYTKSLSAEPRTTPPVLGSAPAQESTRYNSIINRIKIIEKFGYGSRAEEVAQKEQPLQSIMAANLRRSKTKSPSKINAERLRKNTTRAEASRVKEARIAPLSSRDFVTTFSNYIRLGVSSGEREQYIEALKGGITESTPPKIATYVKMISSPGLRTEAALELESFAGLKEQGDVRKAIAAIKTLDKSGFEAILRKYQKKGGNAVVRVMLEKMNPYDPYSGRKPTGISVAKPVGEYPAMRDRGGLNTI